MNLSDKSVAHTATIPVANLPHFLERAAAIIGYAYDTWDTDAIRSGLRDPSTPRYDYAFHIDSSPTPPISFRFTASAASNNIAVTFTADFPFDKSIQAFAELMQDFDPCTDYANLLPQIDDAFADTPPPGDNPFATVACTPEHLAVCEECQEALTFFRQSNWQDLLRNEALLPSGFADISLLSAQAARFAFPAYLASALFYRDFSLLEPALRKCGTDWLSPLGNELVYLAQSGLIYR